MGALTEEEIRKRAYELWKVAERNKPYIKMDAFSQRLPLAPGALVDRAKKSRVMARNINVTHERRTRCRFSIGGACPLAP